MIKQSRSRHCAFPLSGMAVWLSLALILALAVAQSATRRSQAASHTPQSLTFEERVAHQRAIEEVYWRHRLWPQDNLQPKPALDEVLPESVIREKVEDYLRRSQALERYWQRPITGEQLQAEMERMARQTKQPEVLRELWAALGNDPLVIAECLARPSLAERLSREQYASDERFHGELKRRAEAESSWPDAVGQMRRMSGEYREVERINDESGTTVRRQKVERDNAEQATTEHWRAQVNKLVAGLDTASLEGLPVGRLSGLQEDAERFYVVAVMERGLERMKVASVEWRKVPFDQWWSSAQGELKLGEAASGSEFSLPQILAAAGPCDSETWTATSTSGAPTARNAYAVVWTGSEMIIWGGLDGTNLFSTGGRYNPATDTWTATSTTGAPAARSAVTGVWTGSEMIVWGGASSDFLNTGGRYNPATNTWQPTTTTNAPTPRFTHTAVWTGSEMVVWGGIGGSPLTAFDTGGRYNPVTNAWMPTSLSNAPSTRLFHTAVWTGSEMIVWGGFDTSTGRRYNPATDIWTATTTTGAPSSRFSHSAVWTGSEMIVWGGFGTGSVINTGGRYNPATNTWTETTTTGAPTARDIHTAVWTGSEMIIWGGWSGTATSIYFNTGGRYDPAANTWVATTTTNAPSARNNHSAVWTGNAMIVWGGLVGSTRLGTGGRYAITSGLAISPTSQSFPSNGGSGSVNVTSPSSCAWTATSNDSWITITSGSSGSGNGTVNFSVAANTSTSSRTGTLTITGQTFTVTQAGATAAAREVRAVNASGNPGGTVAVPVELVAQGNENALAFSLTFDPAVLSNPQAALGSGAGSATLITNPNQVAQGRLGVIVSLPTGQMFTAGTKQILVVTLTIASGTTANSTPVGFGDQPTRREVSDPNANVLSATFTPGQVTITRGLEADVAPRPDGNGSVTLADYVQIGRFVAGLDTPAPGSEFQRADCAPRVPLGDGAITLADYVQAGRYVAGLDPVVPAGGPTGPSTSAPAREARVQRAPALKNSGNSEVRLVHAVTGNSEQGRGGLVIIELEAQGNENAFSLSLNFDPRQWRFASATAGSDASRAALQVNAKPAWSGRVGITLALPPGEALAAGRRQALIVTFSPIDSNDDRPLAIEFGDDPVARELVDVRANTLNATYTPISTIGTSSNISAASDRRMRLANGVLATVMMIASGNGAALTATLPVAAAATEWLRVEAHQRVTAGCVHPGEPEWPRRDRHLIGG